MALNRPVLGSVATPDGLGYYLFASDGGIFTFGDAAFLRLDGRACGSTGRWWPWPWRPTGGATGSSASDGGLFAFGGAGFFGSMGAVRLNRPVSAVVPGQAGYLMVGEDGGAFSFGDVDFFGSLARPPAGRPRVRSPSRCCRTG